MDVNVTSCAIKHHYHLTPANVKKLYQNLEKQSKTLSNLNILHGLVITYYYKNKFSLSTLPPIKLLAAELQQRVKWQSNSAIMTCGHFIPCSHWAPFQSTKTIWEINIFQLMFSFFLSLLICSFQCGGNRPSRAELNSKQRKAKGRASSHAAFDELSQDETNIDLTQTADRIRVNCCFSR